MCLGMRRHCCIKQGVIQSLGMWLGAVRAVRALLHAARCAANLASRKLCPMASALHCIVYVQHGMPHATGCGRPMLWLNG
jgi:hypothetical protein